MIIYTVLIIVIAIIGVLMTISVLLQSGKGGGLAGIVGGGGATQLLGGRQAPDILEKATWVLATVFISLCIVTNFFIDTAETRQSIIQSQSPQVPAQDPVQAPAVGQPSSGGDAPTAPATPDQ